MGCFTRLKKYLKDVIFPPGTTPVSIMFLLTLAFGAFAYGLVITMPYAFLPSMIKSFGYAEKDVGYYAGMVAASYYAGQTLTSYFWGWLCDRIGSKQAHMITTMLLMIMTIMFGLSESFRWAFGSRFSQGIIGALFVTSKANIFSVCDKTNSGITFSVIVSSYFIGSVLGPALGGYLVYPCKNLSNFCSKHSMFDSYPFLLPNLVCSASLFLTALFSYCYIPSLRRKPADEEKALSNDKSENPSEQTRIKDGGFTNIYSYDSVVMNESYTILSLKLPSTSGETKEDVENIETFLYCPLEQEQSKKRPTRDCCMSCLRFIKGSSIFQLLRIQQVGLAVGFYAILSFANIGFQEVYPVFADSSYQYGGLQFTADEIGKSLLFSSLPLIVFSFILAKISKKLGETMMIVSSSLVLVFILPLFPFISILKKSQAWFLLVLALFLVKYFLVCLVFAITLLLNSSTPPHLIGAVNGLGMTVSCLFRMLGPGTLGPLYTWSLGNEDKFGFPFNHCFSFALMGFLMFVSLIFTPWMPKKTKSDALKVDVKVDVKVDEIQPSVSQNSLEDKSCSSTEQKRE